METKMERVVNKEVYKQMNNTLQNFATQLHDEAEAVPDSDTETLSFLNYYKHKLQTGEYVFTSNLELKVSGHTTTDKTPTKEQRLVIDGPRYKIDSKDVVSVFPPANSAGAYGNVLPHIVLSRPTLPWEISLGSNANTPDPWMALLVLVAEEEVSYEQKVLSEVVDSRTIPAYHDKDQKISVVKVGDEIQQIDKPELFVHLREIKLIGKEKQIRAFVVGNRLPKQGKNIIVHVISLKDKIINSYNEPNTHSYLSLYRWEFICEPSKPNFKETLFNLPLGNFRLETPDGMNKYCQLGYVPLPHYLKSRNTVASLYRSPLLPLDITKNNSLSNPVIEKGNSRIFWDEQLNLADVSYDCAYQLGKLLTVANKNIAKDIYNWSRKYYQSVKNKKLKQHFNFLGIQLGVEPDYPELTDTMQAWIKTIMHLKNIPFNYLVPYPSMLPENNVRFFRLDSSWLMHCLEGVFSIGEEYSNFKASNLFRNKTYTGCILHSAIVNDYPQLAVTAFAKNGEELSPAFTHKPDDAVLLAAFDGEIHKLEIFLPVEAVYMGFELMEEKYYSYKKDTDGKVIQGRKIDCSEVIGDLLYIDIKKLHELLGNTTSPQAKDLAIQTIQGSPKRIISV